MCFAARHGFYIKVLKDLEMGLTRISIDIKVLKDLKRENRDREGSPTNNDRGGQAPALRVSRPPPFTVGRGPSDATRASERVSLASVRSPKKTSLRSVRP